MGLFDDWQAQKDSQYILAVDYLEQLAKQHDSTIEATANYLMLTKDMKIYERLSTGEYVEPYHDFNNPPPIIEFFDNAKAVYRLNGGFTPSFYFETGGLYFKKSELPAIEQVAPSEPQAGKIKPLNSLASFVTSYNLPQVAALILGISFEYIHITKQTAQIDENEFSYDIVIKFDKLLQSLIATAESGNLQGFSISYFDQNNPFYLYNSYGDNPQYPIIKTFDYLNSVIDKASLETYLKSIGKDLSQLLELQEPLTAPTPQTDSQLSQQVADQQATIDSQAKEIAELKAQLASIEQAGKDTQSDTPADGEPLALVFDSTNANYAPDLVYALNLWLDLYHRNPKDSDSHTNKAKNWLNKNTGYDEFKDKQSFNRIREIATPLKDFGTQRSRENKK